MRPSVKYSVIIPVYKNQNTIDETVRRMELMAEGFQWEMEAVFVVDGSPDESLKTLTARLASSNMQHQILELSRNFGSFTAIRQGMRVAKGQYLAVMAADLQEPAAVVESFFSALDAGLADVVIGRREGRNDKPTTVWAARVFWTLFRKFVNAEVPVGGVDVFGCTREVGDLVASFSESHTSLVGLIYWVGFRRLEVPYVREKRPGGRSAWTLRKKWRYLSDSVFAFTDLPVVLLQVVGAAGIMLSTLFGLGVFIAWTVGSIDEPGYTSLMLVILGSASALLLGLGIVGSYAWRAFENTKHRPLAIVRTHINNGIPHVPTRHEAAEHD